MKKLLGFLILLFVLTACAPQNGSEEAAGQDSTLANVDTVAAETLSDDTVTTSVVVIDSSAQDEQRRQYIEGAFTVPAAMEVVYGLYDREFECSKWVCKPTEKKSFAGKTDKSGTLHTRAAGVYPIDSKDGKKMLMLTETLSREKDGWENCHACAPILGAAMFQQIDGAWFIEALKKDLDVIGAWGELPSNKLVKFGPDMQGVLFNYGSAGQGVSNNGIELVGILDGKFKVLLDVHTDFSNEGMFPDPKTEPMAFAYTSDLTFKEIAPGKPYQLIIKRKGSRPIDGFYGVGEVLKFSEELTYRIEEGAYVMQDSVYVLEE